MALQERAQHVPDKIMHEEVSWWFLGSKDNEGFPLWLWVCAGTQDRLPLCGQGDFFIICNKQSDEIYIPWHEPSSICSICQGKPRPNIVWYKDGRELYGHRYLHVSKSLTLNIPISFPAFMWSPQTLLHNFVTRSDSSGAGSTGSSLRWRSTRRPRVMLASMSATPTTSNISLFKLDTCP